MKKNKLFTMGALAVMLAFGLVLAGCDTGTGEEPDTWGTVSGFDQLNGTWNGGYNIAPKDLTELMGLMGGLMGDLDDMGMMEIIKPMIQGVKVDMSIGIDNDAAKKTVTIKSAKATMTFSDDNAQMILGGIESLPLELPEGIVLNINGNNLIIGLTNLPLLELSGAGYDDTDATAAILKNFEINQHGTKIKVSMDMPEDMPMDIPEGLLPKDFILAKQ
jgi:hypothetical protein